MRLNEKEMDVDLINRINRYIDENLQERITLDRLCKEFHYGRTKISTAYKKLTGVGINTYLMQQRLKRGQELLEEGKYTVTEIAERTGFASTQYFSRKFSEIVGYAPTKYAELYKENKHRSKSDNLNCTQ